MIPTLSYPQTIDEDWQKYKSYLTSEGKNLISLGGFLIEYKKEKILMDLGIGDRVLSLPIAEFEGGELLNNLKKAGVDRKDITKVIYTHLHTDHIGWTSIEENGKQVLTFPNAEYYCSQYDWEFWKDKTEDPLGVDEKKFIEAHEDKIKHVERKGSSLKPCAIAHGLAEITLRRSPNTKEWDTAACQIVVEEAGGLFVEPDGTTIRYNREDVYNRKGYTVVNRKENLFK